MLVPIELGSQHTPIELGPSPVAFNAQRKVGTQGKHGGGLGWVGGGCFGNRKYNLTAARWVQGRLISEQNFHHDTSRRSEGRLLHTLERHSTQISTVI